jgi:hypothetical protein
VRSVNPIFSVFLATLILLADASRTAGPAPTIPPPPVDRRIDATVYSNCPDAKSKLVVALRNSSPQAWSSYVGFMMRCGESKQGLTQARIYTQAVLGIASILDFMPDAYGSADWRKTARRIISSALPNAKADPELVDVLYSLDRELTVGVRPADRRPNVDSVVPAMLVPPGATGVGSSPTGDETEIWFAMKSGSSGEAESAVRAHLRNRGWYFCPPGNPNGIHTAIVMHYVGPSPTRDPHMLRKPDRAFYASLRNEWDVRVFLYAEPANTIKGVYLVNQVTMAPHCSAYKDYFGASDKRLQHGTMYQAIGLHE